MQRASATAFVDALAASPAEGLRLPVARDPAAPMPGEATTPPEVSVAVEEESASGTDLAWSSARSSASARPRGRGLWWLAAAGAMVVGGVLAVGAATLGWFGSGGGAPRSSSTAAVERSAPAPVLPPVAETLVPVELPSDSGASAVPVVSDAGAEVMAAIPQPLNSLLCNFCGTGVGQCASSMGGANVVVCDRCAVDSFEALLRCGWEPRWRSLGGSV